MEFCNVKWSSINNFVNLPTAIKGRYILQLRKVTGGHILKTWGGEARAVKFPVMNILNLMGFLGCMLGISAWYKAGIMLSERALAGCLAATDGNKNDLSELSFSDLYRWDKLIVDDKYGGRLFKSSFWKS